MIQSIIFFYSLVVIQFTRAAFNWITWRHAFRDILIISGTFLILNKTGVIEWLFS